MGYFPEIEGETLEEAAARMGLSVPEAARSILIRCAGRVDCIWHSIDRGDMLKIMARTDIATASDGTAYVLNACRGRPHPRNVSTFARFLQTVREEKIMPLEDAVYKITALPAALMGMGDRIGSLKPGYPGDVTIFDFETIADRSTWQSPLQAPTGIRYVLVNGEIVLDHGAITPRRPGRFYRKT